MYSLTKAALFLGGVSIYHGVSSFNPSSFIMPSAPSRTQSSKLFMAEDKKRVVVIGNGMVGQRFMENMIDLDKDGDCTLATFCEERRAAYNRVKLTSYFETRNPSDLSMTEEYDDDGKTAWFDDNNVEIFLNDKAVDMDTEAKTITGASGKKIDYDVAVLATGSFRKSLNQLILFLVAVSFGVFSLTFSSPFIHSLRTTNSWKTETWCFRLPYY
jgi:hypothetical protein